MKLRCPGCQAVLTLADEKIPAGKELKILCPRCRTPIERTISETDQERPVGQQSVAPVIVTGGAETELDSPEDLSSALELLDVEEPLALVLISQTSVADKVETILRDAGFYVTAAASVGQGLAMLNRHSFAVVVTDVAATPAQAPQGDMLAAIGTLPMHVRRQFLLCLVSEALPTLDRLSAFSKGADLVINVNELDRGKILLNRTLQERTALYAVFKEELENKGSF